MFELILTFFSSYQKGDWVVADIALPWMDKLEIYGVLELDNDPDKDGNQRSYTLNATVIFIQGGRLIIGWPDKPFMGHVDIILRGNHYTPDFPQNDGPVIGSKAIGMFVIM